MFRILFRTMFSATFPATFSIPFPATFPHPIPSRVALSNPCRHFDFCVLKPAVCKGFARGKGATRAQWGGQVPNRLQKEPLPVRSHEVTEGCADVARASHCSSSFMSRYVP